MVCVWKFLPQIDNKRPNINDRSFFVGAYGGGGSYGAGANMYNRPKHQHQGGGGYSIRSSGPAGDITGAVAASVTGAPFHDQFGAPQQPSSGGAGLLQ